MDAQHKHIHRAELLVAAQRNPSRCASSAWSACAAATMNPTRWTKRVVNIRLVDNVQTTSKSRFAKTNIAAALIVKHRV